MHAVLTAAVGLAIVAATGGISGQGVDANRGLIATPPTVFSSVTILI